MRLVGAGWQGKNDTLYRADGTIASATVPQLVLPNHANRSFLIFQNNSAHVMWLEFGSARATCTISGGKVNAVSVTNAGFNFSRAPLVTFYGGGILPQQGQYPQNSSYIGAPGPDFPSPTHPAQAHCVMTGSAGALSVSSIVIDDPGNGYVIAPMVFIQNDVLDPNGCADPSVSSGSGLQIEAFGTIGNALYLSGTAVPTDSMAVFCGTTTSAFFCGWMA
jgi:hypothetical protein